MVQNKDPLEQLKRELQKYDFNEPEATPDRAQGDKIRETLDKILDNDGGELGRQLPLKLLAYAFNTILYPSFLPELISDLIHLITMIEFYRLQLTEKASLLIGLNMFFELNRDSQVSSLTKRQRKYFQRLVDDRETLRQIFLTNVSTLCVLDLKRLWLANRDTDFWFHWSEYFSVFQEDHDPEKLSHPFHHKIQPKEIAFLQDSVSQLPEFMDATVRTAVEQASPGQSIQEMFQSTTFREQFISNTLPPEVLEALVYHRNVVLDAAEEIKAIQKMG